MNRRGFLGAMLAACAAPAIVRAGSLMRINQKIIIPESPAMLYDWVEHFKELQARAFCDAMESALMYGMGVKITIMGGLNAQRTARQFIGSTQVDIAASNIFLFDNAVITERN